MKPPGMARIFLEIGVKACLNQYLFHRCSHMRRGADSYDLIVIDGKQNRENPDHNRQNPPCFFCQYKAEPGDERETHECTWVL